jgi:hypothetical protein
VRASTVSQEKTLSGLEKILKLFLLPSDMIVLLLNLQIPIESTKMLVQLISKRSNNSGHKINIQNTNNGKHHLQ